MNNLLCSDLINSIGLKQDSGYFFDSGHNAYSDRTHSDYCSLILLAALKALRMRCAKRVEEVEREGVSAADYAVMVWGLPADASTEEIRLHFNRIAAMDSGTAGDEALKSSTAAGGADAAGIDCEVGEVAAVHIARREGASLGEWRRLAKVQVKLRRLRGAVDRRRNSKSVKAGSATWDSAADLAAASSGTAETASDKKLAKLKLRLEKQEARLRRALGSGSARRAVCAFVVSH